ncbi:hypothetical protein [Actinomadura flavalba]|uniref:hypothetical protein n=1 Tax=Actinomadura flavalba TaxID=1120938 RepID=UPI0003A6F466|nr:hypothetical protein [Actinomadura flavalba]
MDTGTRGTAAPHRAARQQRAAGHGHDGIAPARTGQRTPPLLRRVARDRRLTRAALGLVAEWWTHVDGWTWTAQALWRATRHDPAVEGRDALAGLLREAVAVGYAVAVAGRSEDDLVYALNRSAAPPDDGSGFLHVPWATARDRRLSYRQRGLLVAELADGATVGGVTVRVRRGGAAALAGERRGERLHATTGDLHALAAAGYATSEPERDDAGRVLTWRTTLRSAPATLPAPVENPAPDAPAPTCDDTESPQVTATPGNPVRESQNVDTLAPTCADAEYLQVNATPGDPGTTGGFSQGGEFREVSAKPRGSVHVGDAPAKETLREPKNDHAPDPDARPGNAPAPVRPPDRADGRHPGAGAPRPRASRAAWTALAAMPRALRDAPPWVRAELARRLDRLLDEQRPRMSPCAALTSDVLAASVERIAAAEPWRLTGRHHLDLLHAAAARARADLAAGDICPTCGAPTVHDGRCWPCTWHAAAPPTDHEQRQLAAAHAHLTGRTP